MEEPSPKLTQQYSTGWMEKNWKAYLHAMSMISSGEAQNFKQTVVQETRLERRKQDISIHWDGAVLRLQHNSLTSEQVWRKPGVNPTGKEQSLSETKS